MNEKQAGYYAPLKVDPETGEIHIDSEEVQAQGQHILLQRMLHLAGKNANIAKSSIHELPDELLLECFDHYVEALKTFEGMKDRVEVELLRRMEEREATSIPSNTYEVKVTSKDTYDQARFTPLKEVLFESDLLHCYTPAHEKTELVPEKWDTTKLKAACRKYGAQALRTFEEAKIPGRPRLSVKAKEED